MTRARIRGVESGYMVRRSRNFEALRGLPEAVRSELLVAMRKPIDGVSTHRLERLSRIIARHVFENARPGALCRELGISRQQFYVDLREGLQRLTTALNARTSRTGPVSVYDPTLALVSQAHAHYQAYEPAQVISLLKKLDLTRLTPALACEVASLQSEALEDSVAPLPELVECLHRLQRANEQPRAALDADENALLEGTAHWLQSRIAWRRNEPTVFRHKLNQMVAALRLLAHSGDRDATVLFSRFLLDGAHRQSYFGNLAASEPSLQEASALVQARNDLPLTLLPELYITRAMVHMRSVTKAALAQSEYRQAYKLGVDRCFARPVWLGLNLEVQYSLAKGRLHDALDCATALVDLVSVSDNVGWQKVARGRLARVYNALGRFEDVEHIFPASRDVREIDDPMMVLSLCHMLIGRARYNECRSLANIVVKRLDDDKRSDENRALALAFRAEAEYRLRDIGSATEDVKEALAFYETVGSASPVGALSTYRLAYAITGERLYAETLREMETALDNEETEATTLWKERLTKRQQQVAQLAATGATNREIAAKLNLSLHTVGNCLNAIYDRLGIRARWQIAETVSGRTFHTMRSNERESASSFR
jgi:DNA-binding CsgD family transcriptional regulator